MHEGHVKVCKACKKKAMFKGKGKKGGLIDYDAKEHIL